jgi:hypothetical protein
MPRALIARPESGGDLPALTGLAFKNVLQRLG